MKEKNNSSDNMERQGVVYNEVGNFIPYVPEPLGAVYNEVGNFKPCKTCLDVRHRLKTLESLKQGIVEPPVINDDRKGVVYENIGFYKSCRICKELIKKIRVLEAEISEENK